LEVSDTTHIQEFVNLKFYSTVPKLYTEKLFYQSKQVKKLYWATGLSTAYTWVSQKYKIWIYSEYCHLHTNN